MTYLVGNMCKSVPNWKRGRGGFRRREAGGVWVLFEWTEGGSELQHRISKRNEEREALPTAMKGLYVSFTEVDN